MKHRTQGLLLGILLAVLLLGTVTIVSAASQSINVTYGINVIVNGVRQTFSDDMRPFASGGRTFLPEGGIAEVLGADVSWDAATSTVYINSGAPGTQSPTAPPPGINAAVGDIIEFGGYEWRVLEVRDGNALILNENIIKRRAYNVDGYDTTWEYSSLRSYLNGEFYDSFTQAERTRIVETRNANADNQWFGTAGGSETADRIFLLSLEEVVQYFGDSGQLSSRPSDNAIAIDDRFNSMRTAGERAGHISWWWLRSPGHRSGSAANVGSGGTVNVMGFSVGTFSGGVRPAMWINLQS